MPKSPGASRRSFLTASASLGLATLASASLARAAPGRPTLALAASARPGSERIAAAARAGLARAGARLAHRDVVGVANFSPASSTPRLHLVDVASGRVESLLVAHGRGSDPAHTGWLQRFSNAPGSDCTSAGAYLTGGDYLGEHGRSMRLIGLDPSNDAALERGIVVHSAWYVSPAMVRAHGMLGRSEGCFAVSEADLPHVLDRLGPGRLLIAGKL